MSMLYNTYEFENCPFTMKTAPKKWLLTRVIEPWIWLITNRSASEITGSLNWQKYVFGYGCYFQWSSLNTLILSRFFFCRNCREIHLGNSEKTMWIRTVVNDAVIWEERHVLVWGSFPMVQDTWVLVKNCGHKVQSFTTNKKAGMGQ